MHADRTRAAVQGAGREDRGPGRQASTSIVAPAAGGIIPGLRGRARIWACPSIYVEREGGELQAAPRLPRRAVAKVVAWSRTSSPRACRRASAIERDPGRRAARSSAAACIVDRSGGKADVGVPLIALATLDVPAYAADALPPELAAIPGARTRGSRRLTAFRLRQELRRERRCRLGSA